VEDNAVQGGAGSAVSEFLNEEGLLTQIINLGIPDTYIDHATREEQLLDIGLSGEGIVKQIKSYIDLNWADVSSSSVA
jgi:1-deoxy-D-xylulose-5-phosphate synthase